MKPDPYHIVISSNSQVIRNIAGVFSKANTHTRYEAMAEEEEEAALEGKIQGCHFPLVRSAASAQFPSRASYPPIHPTAKPKFRGFMQIHAQLSTFTLAGCPLLDVPRRRRQRRRRRASKYSSHLPIPRQP